MKDRLLSLLNTLFAQKPYAQIDRSTHKKLGWSVFLYCLIAYLITMPFTVGFEDSGLFASVCYYAGIAHPPGYPLYTILCPPFAHIPFITPAHGVAIFSAVTAALASVAIAFICLRLTGHFWAALGAGLVNGLSLYFWSQAVTQEVYALNAMLFFWMFAFSLELAHKPCRRWLFLLALTAGLGLSNHWPLFVLAGVLIPFVLTPAWRDLWTLLKGWHFFIALGCFLAGLLPYLYMWLRSLSDPFISFYGPITTWKDFVFYLTRKGYSSVDDQGANLNDKQDFFYWFLDITVAQFSWVWIALAILGLLMLLKNRVVLGMGLTLSILSGSLLLLLYLLNFTYSLIWRDVFRVYPLTSWGLVVLLGGVGLYQLQIIINRYVKKGQWLSTALVGLVVAYLSVINGQLNWRDKTTFADQFATTILDSLEQNAILITYDDSHLPIIYKRYAEHYRPDVTLYNGQSLALGNRLTTALTPTKKKDAVYAELVRKSTRPTYVFYEQNVKGHFEDYGILKKVLSISSATHFTYKAIDPLIDLVKKTDVFNTHDQWTRNMQIKLANRMSEIYYKLADSDPQKAPLRAALESTAYGNVAQAYAWYENRSPESEYARHVDNLKRIKSHFERQDPYDQSLYYEYLGRVQSIKLTRLNYQLLEKTLLEGVGVYEANDSPPLKSLLELYAQVGEDKKMAHWESQYPNVIRGSEIITNLRKTGFAEPDHRVALLEKQQKINTIYQKGLDALVAGKPELILEQMNLLQAIHPDSVEVYFLGTGMAVLQREYQKALMLLTKLLAIDPNHFDGLINISKILIYFKQYDEAAMFLGRAQALEPENPQVVQLLSLLNRLQQNNQTQ